jgi:hypothetical protein
MAKPLDFLNRNKNQDEWARRYVGNKMGIQQMQEGGFPKDTLMVSTPSDTLKYMFERSSPDSMKSIMEKVHRTAPKEVFDESQKQRELDIIEARERQKLLMEQNPELFAPQPEVKKSFLQKLLGMQHGGAVFESAPADETAHDQMNNLIFENEMEQSQGASPLSFLNRDRIDSQNQSLMDAVMSMSVPAAGALSIGKSAFGKLANFPREKVLSQIPVMKEIGKVNWNQFAKKGMPKSAQKSFENIKDLNWLEDLIRRNQ